MHPLCMLGTIQDDRRGTEAEYSGLANVPPDVRPLRYGRLGPTPATGSFQSDDRGPQRHPRRNG